MEKRSRFLQGDFPQHLFGNLKVFEVARDDSACFPLGLVERLHNLEILSLHVCLYEEIFSNEGYLEQHVGIKKFTSDPTESSQVPVETTLQAGLRS